MNNNNSSSDNTNTSPENTDAALTALIEAVSVPETVIVDGQHVKQRPLDELIAADAYLKKTAAAARRNSGLKFTKLSHTGA